MKAQHGKVNADADVLTLSLYKSEAKIFAHGHPHTGKDIPF